MTTIADEDIVYRRLHQNCFKQNGAVSSAAFKTNSRPDNQISVDLARLTTPEESVSRKSRSGFRLGELEAGGPRQLGFDVIYDRKPDNSAHSLIVGENSANLCKQLALLVRVIPDLYSQDKTV